MKREEVLRQITGKRQCLWQVEEDELDKSANEWPERG